MWLRVAEDKVEERYVYAETDYLAVVANLTPPGWLVVHKPSCQAIGIGVFFRSEQAWNAMQALATLDWSFTSLSELSKRRVMELNDTAQVLRDDYKALGALW